MKRSERWQLSIFACASLILACASAHAAAAGPGSMVVHGKTTVFTNAYAFHHPASYDKDVIQTTILLSEKAVDIGKIKAAGGDLAKVAAWFDDNKIAYWQATFYPDGTFWSGDLFSPGELHYGGIGCDLEMTRNDAKRVEGSCRTKDEKEKEDKKEGLYVDVKFALDL